MNPGKVFEHDFRDSAKGEGIFFLRLNDTYVLNLKIGKEKLTKTNPCDCIVFYRGYLFPLELKSTEYKSITMDRNPNDDKMIRLGQINSLTQFSDFKNVEPGFIFNFRGKEGEDPLTYWVPIEDFNEFYNTTDKKSINQLDIVLLKNSAIMSQEKKRIHYSYRIKELLDKIIDGKEASSAGLQQDL